MDGMHMTIQYILLFFNNALSIVETHCRPHLGLGEGEVEAIDKDGKSELWTAVVLSLLLLHTNLT